LLKFWGKKSPKFHLRFRFGKFLSFFFLKNWPRKPFKSFFHALFSCFGEKYSQDTKIRHDNIFKKKKTGICTFSFWRTYEKIIIIIVRGMLFPKFQNSFVLKS